VFAASKGRQVSFEPSSARALRLDEAKWKPLAEPAAEPHGFFTGALLSSLDDPASDHDGDGAIELSEIVDEVERRVGEATDGQQTPWVARRELFGDFALAPAPHGAPTPR
jgi:hypothetical protein